MENPTQEDYHELKKANESLEKEKKNLEAKIANQTKSTDEQIKALQAQVEEHDKKEKERQAADHEREEKEKHEIATRIAQSEITTNKIKEANIEDRVKELKLQDAKVLQAMLPFAEESAKKHLEAKQAVKQASMSSLRPGGSFRYDYDDGIDQETRNKQAAESKDFLKSFRSGMYS